MSDDKMRETELTQCDKAFWEKYPMQFSRLSDTTVDSTHILQKRADFRRAWQAACASKEAEIAEEVGLLNSTLDSRNRELEYMSGVLAAKDKLLQIALDKFSHIKWIKDCGIDSSQGNHPEDERDAMYRIANEAITQIQGGIAADDIKFDDKSFCQPDGLPANPSANNDRLLELVKKSGGEVGREWTEETSTTFKTEKQLRTFYELIRKEVVPEGCHVVAMDDEDIMVKQGAALIAASKERKEL